MLPKGELKVLWCLAREHSGASQGSTRGASQGNTRWEISPVEEEQAGSTRGAAQCQSDQIIMTHSILGGHLLRARANCRGKTRWFSNVRL